jgi:hypothetical protein
MSKEGEGTGDTFSRRLLLLKAAGTLGAAAAVATRRRLQPPHYHESIDKLTPADVYFGRDPTILAERERIKRQTIAHRRLQHQLHAA